MKVDGRRFVRAKSAKTLTSSSSSSLSSSAVAKKTGGDSNNKQGSIDMTTDSSSNRQQQQQQQRRGRSSSSSTNIPHPSLWRYPSIYIEPDEERSTRSLSTRSLSISNHDGSSSLSLSHNNIATTSEEFSEEMSSSPPASSLIETADDEEDSTLVDSIPIGVPVEFESDLFRGRILFRFRNESQSEDPETDKKYFEGRKRLVQFVVQGRFKEPISMDDLYVGDHYDRPLKGLPPAMILKTVNMFFKKLVPGAIIDLTADKPKVLTLYGGNVQVLRVDAPGEEPDIKGIHIQEDTTKLGFKNTAHRKRILRNPKKAQKMFFDTEHVYTFDHYDDIMDTANYHCYMGMLGKFDMTKVLNGQPMSIGAVTKDGRWLYRFRAHNARHMAMLMAEQEEET